MTDVINTHSLVREISIIKSSGVRLGKRTERNSIDNVQTVVPFQQDFQNGDLENSGNNDVAHFAEKLHEEYERGYSDARIEIEMEMLRSGSEQVQSRVQSVENLIQQISKEYNAFRERIEKMVPKLSVAIAEKIIRKQITISNDFIVNQVRDAVRRVVGVEKVRVRINPEDEAILREHRSLLMKDVDSIHDVIIESDEKIEQGGCIIESEMGNVDARIATQLKQIEEAFQG